MAISRMQIPRELMAEGGIMTLEEPRQGYFLGRIVKKAKRAVKKITKSPIGKLALAAGLGYGLGGGTFFGKSLPFLKNTGGFSLANLGANLGFGSIGSGGKFAFDGPLAGLVSKDGKFSLGRAGLTGLGVASLAAPFLMGGGDDEEEPEAPFSETPASITDIVNQARRQDASLRFLPKPKFVDNFYLADGGISQMGDRMPMQEGGIMDLGGMEKDYRTGGFVELGAEERADDVPARLSKNEFVFTADAVRNAGGGDIDKGAEVMQNMMDNLEAGGMISEESQGMNPAQEMFDQSQMMESRLA